MPNFERESECDNEYIIFTSNKCVILKVKYLIGWIITTWPTWSYEIEKDVVGKVYGRVRAN